MCGIVAACAGRHVEQILLNGLKRLEYRGYDSAGMSLFGENSWQIVRAVGKVAELEAKLQQEQSSGWLGIAHTRWATHGGPSTANAHPQCSSDGKIILVHNGIIENHRQLREQMLRHGFSFASDTDTEVIVALISYHCQTQPNFREAVQAALPRLAGAYALAVCSVDHPDMVIGARYGSPLLVGLGIEENYLSSDALALAGLSEDFIYLEPHEVVEIRASGVRLYDADGAEIELKDRVQKHVPEQHSLDKGEHKHFMHQEIFSQPRVLQDCLQSRVTDKELLVSGLGYEFSQVLASIRQIQICACGTSMHAGLTAKYWLEQLAGIPTQVEVASEYRYRDVAIPEAALFLTISQSGETADSLAALQSVGRHFPWQLAICNVAYSSMMRECKYNLQTFAGREIGVASTKAYAAQLIALLYLTLALAKERGQLSSERESQLVMELHNIGQQIEAVLALEGTIAACAQRLHKHKKAMFLGRNLNYPLALESALKLKEISYIHAEAYPGGELKHGPLALIDSDMPTVAFASYDHTADKLFSNLAEIKARDGAVFLFYDQRLKPDASIADFTVALPPAHPLLAPIVYAAAGQLLAYHTALLLGTDIDQPRNLAKSVTVE